MYGALVQQRRANKEQHGQGLGPQIPNDMARTASCNLAGKRHILAVYGEFESGPAIQLGYAMVYHLG